MDITERILHLHPDAKFLCRENDYNRIDWHPENSYQKPSLSSLEAISQEAIDLERKTSQASQAIDLSPLEKTIFKQIFLIRKALTPSLTLSQYQQELINDYKAMI